MISTAAAVVGGVIFFVSGNLAFALVGLFLVGVGMALLNTMTWALEADTVEYGEYQTGIRTEGATYPAFSFTRKGGAGHRRIRAGLVRQPHFVILAAG